MRVSTRASAAPPAGRPRSQPTCPCKPFVGEGLQGEGAPRASAALQARIWAQTYPIQSHQGRGNLSPSIHARFRLDSSFNPTMGAAAPLIPHFSLISLRQPRFSLFSLHRQSSLNITFTVRPRSSCSSSGSLSLNSRIARRMTAQPRPRRSMRRLTTMKCAISSLRERG